MAIKYTMTSPILESCDEGNLEIIRDLRRLPYETRPVFGHIYFLFDGDEVVYVGQTKQGEARVYDHRKEPNYKEFDSFSMLECDIGDLDEIESRWICALQPKYNKSLGVATEYCARTNSKIKNSFPGMVFNYLVKNYSIRTIQLNATSKPKYNLADLHKAATIALQTGKIELVEEVDGELARYEYVSELTARVRRNSEKNTAKYKALREQARLKEIKNQTPATITEEHSPELTISNPYESIDWQMKALIYGAYEIYQNRPLFLSSSLATVIGVNEAIFLENLHQTIETQLKNNHNKHPYWVVKTKEEWVDRFPFWSTSTVKRTIQSLKHQALINTTSVYNEHPADKTLWYTINYENIPNLTNNEESLDDSYS